ncbi:MAG: glycosyltransferase family 39 protein, partial [Thermoplasmatales archaeon]
MSNITVKIFLLFFTLVFGFLASPYSRCGLPYVHDMDEQSHLARVVEMMKKGKWDPGYYQKPAVHFYLRIPVTAGAFLFEVSRGNLKRLDQLETQDRFNLGGYASASNPPVMILVNRYLSLVCVSFGIFLLALIIQNNGGFFMAVVFALFCSFSLPFVEYCCRLSVDPIAAFFVCATMFFSYRFITSGEKPFLVLGAISAGLAFSTKYNFIASMLLPLIAVLAQRTRAAKGNMIIACISICV